jgi:hypothetical protein
LENIQKKLYLKTPEKEIEKAENIRLRYFELKNKRNEK